MRQSIKQLLRQQHNVTMTNNRMLESLQLEAAELPEGKGGAAWTESPSGRRPFGPPRG